MEPGGAARVPRRVGPGPRWLGRDAGGRGATAGGVRAARARVEAFDLFAPGWLPTLDGAGAVISSLALHHLDGHGKQNLFNEVAGRLAPGGAFLVADIVEPAGPAGRRYAADLYDHLALEGSVASTGGRQAYDRLVAEEWNYFRFPDAVDTPSTLADQLRWLAEAGLVDADCLWLQAGHAVYGGYRPGGEAGAGIPYDEASAIARESLGLA